MDDPNKRRELLALWGLEFLCFYEPEHDPMFSSALNILIASEASGNVRDPSDRQNSRIEPGPIYNIGQEYVKRWNAPFTMGGLVALLWKAKDANQAQMLVAVMLTRYYRQDSAHTEIDAKAVRTILGGGLPSQAYLAEMWEKQKLLPQLHGGPTIRNLLDYVREEDFRPKSCCHA